jgi:serine/threonine protein kinase
VARPPPAAGQTGCGQARARGDVGRGEDLHALRQRFAREAQATAALRSPHTVQLFDFGTTDNGGFYYVMERLHGMDLQRMVERYGPLTPDRTVFLLKQACLSLSEAHALGLVHRDIKPANLFVCRLGPDYDFLKVLDVAVVAGHGKPDAMTPITAVGVVVGTPAFHAPELLAGEGAFDGRADIYALGCVAFWLLTGRPPFEATDTMALLAHHSKTAPPPPSMFSEEAIPPALDVLVLDCLSKEIASRPAADVLLERLEALAISQPWDRRRARAWWALHEPELLGQT